MNTIERVLRLHEIDLFSLAATEHLGELAVVCREESAKAGETLFRAGEPYPELWILHRGRIRLTGPNGGQRTVREESLDTRSFLAQRQHRVTAEALEDCGLFRLPFDDLVDILTAEPELCLAILQFLAREQVDEAG